MSTSISSYSFGLPASTSSSNSFPELTQFVKLEDLWESNEGYPVATEDLWDTNDTFDDLLEEDDDNESVLKINSIGELPVANMTFDQFCNLEKEVGKIKFNQESVPTIQTSYEQQHAEVQAPLPPVSNISNINSDMEKSFLHVTEGVKVYCNISSSTPQSMRRTSEQEELLAIKSSPDSTVLHHFPSSEPIQNNEPFPSNENTENSEMDPHSILLTQLENSARNADSSVESPNSFSPNNVMHNSPVNTEITDDTIEMLLNGEDSNNSNCYQNGDEDNENRQNVYPNGVDGYHNDLDDFQNGENAYQNGENAYQNGVNGYDNGMHGYANGVDGFSNEGYITEQHQMMQNGDQDDSYGYENEYEETADSDNEAVSWFDASSASNIIQSETSRNSRKLESTSANVFKAVHNPSKIVSLLNEINKRKTKPRKPRDPNIPRTQRMSKKMEKKIKEEGEDNSAVLANYEATHRYVCGKCGKKYTTSGNLKFHEKIQHNDNKDPIICPLCKNTFATKGSLTSKLYFFTLDPPTPLNFSQVFISDRLLSIVVQYTNCFIRF